MDKGVQVSGRPSFKFVFHFSQLRLHRLYLMFPFSRQFLKGYSRVLTLCLVFLFLVMFLLLLLLLLLSRLGVASLLTLPFVLFLLLFNFARLEFLIEGLVLPGELLEVGCEVSYLLFHFSHFWRLATGREQLCIDFH